jgi:phosphonoacetaldehyde hydrolase
MTGKIIGKIQAVVLDWAGTTIDYGSRAPAEVFVEVFRRQGIEVSDREAREPMGMAKREHIQAMMRQPRIADRWEAVFGRPSTEEDIDRMYADFLPLQSAVILRNAQLIPGVKSVIDTCIERGLKIGSTTGYVRQLMDLVAPHVAREGYQPATIVCGDEVPAGQPAPWVLYEAAKRLEVYPLGTIVKVDDTTVGMEAGRHAGMWTVGISQTGNELGLGAEEVAALEPRELEQRLATIEQRMRDAGAHYVIPSVGDLLPVLDEIQRRLDSGERP